MLQRYRKYFSRIIRKGTHESGPLDYMRSDGSRLTGPDKLGRSTGVERWPCLYLSLLFVFAFWPHERLERQLPNLLIDIDQIAIRRFSVVFSFLSLEFCETCLALWWKS